MGQKQSMALDADLRREFGLKPNGIYVLKHDVQNPKPDKRQKYDWRAQVVWPAGLRLTVTEERILDDFRLHGLSAGRFSQRKFLKDCPSTLLRALEEVTPTLNERLKQADLIGFKDEAIEILVKAGKLNPRDVIEAAEQAAKEYDEKEVK